MECASCAVVFAILITCSKHITRNITTAATFPALAFFTRAECQQHKVQSQNA